MEVYTKSFEQLSRYELYDLLRLRCEVFVVEQNCVYQDMDLKDQKALHILGYFKGELVAYTRLFNAGEYFEQPSIGRVLVKKKYRNRKWGHDLMEFSIKAIQDHYQSATIKISAQQYLEKFYNNLGFVTEGAPYLEDGIPHLAMIKN
jgi:ElaA protein